LLDKKLVQVGYIKDLRRKMKKPQGAGGKNEGVPVGPVRQATARARKPFGQSSGTGVVRLLSEI
jgi:hypothetical protein